MEELQSSQFNHEGGDDEIYEKIEAPKFVDFTVPDLSRPDDKSWFCLRVGCDQNHEEDMDPDALYKSFVLRVMAARSPNLRLRKTLNKQALNANMKCPLSAPAKSSKARISRLTAITSISQKMADAKVKVHPLLKLNSTPNAKAKQSSVASKKSLTTPSYKKCLANSNSFRSVQNPKTTVVVPKNRVVAKVLVFHSPKKIERTKASLGCTSVTKIRAGMKNLDIIGQRKHVLGYSCKLSRDTRRDNDKSLPPDPLRRKLSARKVKTLAEVSFLSRDGKGHEAKSSRRLRRQSKGNLERCQGSVPQEVNDYDSIDMEIDGNSRDGSSVSGSSMNDEGNGDEERLTSMKASGNLERREGSVPREVNDYYSSDMEIDGKSRDGSFVSGSSRNNEGNGHDERLTSVKTSGNLGSSNATQEEYIPSWERSPIREGTQSVLSDVSSQEVGSLSNSEEDLEENDPPKSRTLTGKGDESNEGSGGYEENKGSNYEEGKISEEEDPPVDQTLKGVGEEKEAMESDDKENASASDHNRELNPIIDHSERKILGMNEVNENLQKVTLVLGKTLSSASAANGSQGGKYKKTKPTNPKPFRLRTDERGILKEANLKRRLHLLAPLKEETATVPRFPNRNSHRSHENEIQRKDKSQGQCKHKKDEYQGNHIGSDKGVQKAQSQQMRPAYLTTSRCTLQFKDNKVKSALLRQQLVMPATSVRKEATVSPVSADQLSVIKETPSTILRPKEAATTTKSAAASRSYSRGRRPATIPKEPNFHSIHVPRTCTRKLA